MICRRVFFFSITVAFLTLGLCAQERSATHPTRGFQISGTVVNASGGQPLARIEVSIASVEGRVPLHTITADDGYFSFTGLSSGKYALSARGRGFPDQAYEQHELFSTAVVVGPGLDSENLVFRIKPGVRISGTITDEANEPVPDALVWLFRKSFSEGAQSTHMATQARTDDRGQYSFRSLPEGTYFIAVTATPWYAQVGGGFAVRRGYRAQTTPEEQTTSQNTNLDVTYPITYFPGVTESQEATSITAHAGDRVTADLQLTAVPAYSIRVLYPDAKHTGYLEVNQRVFNLTLPVAGSSTGGNVTTINNVPAGHYVFKFRPDTSSESGRELEMDIAGNTEIDASVLQTADVSVAGTIHPVAATSLPQPMFIVFLNRQSNDDLMAEVSSKGEFEFHYGFLSPGDYEVQLGNPHGFVVYSMSATGAKVFGRTLHLSGPGSVHVEVLVSKGTGQVDGIVLRDKKPVAAAMVLLVPQDFQHNLSLVRRDQSDSDGTFTLPRVVPGAYTVVAIQDGWNLQWADPNALKPYLAHGTPVVMEGTRDYHVTVQLQ
ncbi:MAG TPA: carboxypeptidase regulatory-like domain-containing protein [Terriglobales bacterium]|nr:carboxypeptidase regulatory-like domain-containing protein [Terriglobales bacterium]